MKTRGAPTHDFYCEVTGLSSTPWLNALVRRVRKISASVGRSARERAMWVSQIVYIKVEQSESVIIWEGRKEEQELKVLCMLDQV